MPSDAPYCDLAGLFFWPAPFAFFSLFRGTEHRFKKSQNWLFLPFPSHSLLRLNPGVLQGFLKMPGLENRAIYAVFEGVLPFLYVFTSLSGKQGDKEAEDPKRCV
jgi:hypothetical protein